MFILISLDISDHLQARRRTWGGWGMGIRLFQPRPMPRPNTRQFHLRSRLPSRQFRSRLPSRRMRRRDLQRYHHGLSPLILSPNFRDIELLLLHPLFDCRRHRPFPPYSILGISPQHHRLSKIFQLTGGPYNVLFTI